MSSRTFPFHVCRGRIAAVLSLAVFVSACGGADGNGGADPATVPKSTSTAARTVGLVTLEGCVVDDTYVPHEGVAIRVLDVNGRLVGEALSGRLGEFRTLVPPGVDLAVHVHREGGEVLRVPAVDRDSVMQTCLIEPTS